MARKENLRRSAIFHDYYSRLKAIAVTVFEWEGLPETCNARFLEDCLFHEGHAIFVEDSDMRYLNLKVVPSGALNHYNDPLSYRAYSIGYDKDYKADDCVYIRNNPLAKSTESTLIIYAERLARLDSAIDVNINAQKTPILIRCEEKVRSSLEAVYNQYEGDRPVIIGSKALSEHPFETLRTDAPFVADRLREEKRQVWNEALEFLGINTNPADKKKERLIVNEVDSNNEQIESQFAAMLSERQKACEKINKLYGLSVSVRKRIKNESEMEVENDE